MLCIEWYKEGQQQCDSAVIKQFINSVDAN